MGIIGRKEGIEHVDTCVIVRMITRDNEKMLKKARKLFSHTNKLYVFEDAAMMEVVYVLSTSLYKYTRELIAQKIKSILHLENLVCNKSIIEGALDLYVSHPKLSFVDCYLTVVTDASQEKPLWTFDHKLLAQCPFAKEP